MAKTVVFFGDMHVPYQNEAAVDLLKQAITILKPDISISLGDLLDCSQFSTHEPTYGIDESDFADDIDYLNDFLDFVQSKTKTRTVLVEGNHCYRIKRWAAREKSGRGVFRMVDPQKLLMKNRKKATYVPYGSTNGKYPHYKINSRIVCNRIYW